MAEAEAEAEAEAWEESLDLDDSDLLSLRPFKRPNTTTPFLQRCSSPPQNNLPSQLHPPIPGPAGTLQLAMLHRRRSSINNNQNDENALEHPMIIPTQEYIRRAIQESVEDDDDFTRHPWISALQFIHLQGLTDGDGAIGIPLSAIRNSNHLDNKLPQVVAIVKCCTTLNGLGDMMVTLKDPTSTIHATIHRRVLTDSDFGKDISVGAVIILQKVAIFSPSRSAHYLNITHSNLVKVFPKDTAVPLKENYSAPTVKHVAPISEGKENSWMSQKPYYLSQGRTEGIMSSLRKAATRGSSHDEHMERDEATRHRCNTDGNNINQNAIAGMELLLAHQDLDNGSKEATDEKDKNNNDDAVASEQINLPTQAGRDNILERAQHDSAAADTDKVLNHQEGGKVNGTKWGQPVTSSAAPPQWTDEQLNELDELFAFD